MKHLCTPTPCCPATALSMRATALLAKRGGRGNCFVVDAINQDSDTRGGPI